MPVASEKHKDLYKILGVSRGASRDEIRKQYRKLAKKYHPDVTRGDKAAEERFKEVSAAYEVLSDADKRKLYDEFGEDALRMGFDADKARAYREAQRHGPGSGGFGGGSRRGARINIEDLFGDGFRDIFGGFGGGFGGQGVPFQQKGADILGTVEVDLARALSGTEVKFTLPPESAEGAKTITVRIPPGADTGDRLRVSGKGMRGTNGGPPGDLVIETKVKPHPSFRRQGLDLYLDLPVTLAEAYSGATIDVPTPDGPVKLRIPPRSGSGAHLRLKEKGVRRGKKRGDMYAVLQVKMPDAASDELARALEKAEKAYSSPVRAGIKL